MPDDAALRRGFDGLAADACACLRAAVLAADPRRLTAAALRRPGALGSARPARRVRLIAVGKAAVGMTLGAVDVLGDAITAGVTIVPSGEPADLIAAAAPRVEVHFGGHPYATHGGTVGAARALELARGAGSDDVVLVLLSGGASALMTLPVPPLTLEEVAETTRALMFAGADIDELNCVRKHLDQLKGGRLAIESWPAPAIGLVLSDVIGDRLDVIASGPVVGDPTTFADAIGILCARRLWRDIPPAVAEHLRRGAVGEIADTPKPGDPALGRASASVIGSSRIALAAARDEAEQRGYAAEIVATDVSGEARTVGVALVRRALDRWRSSRERRPLCLITGGETTVTVRGSGRGGRNQELAVGAAVELGRLLDAHESSDDDETPRVVVGSMGTDGIDGPTDAAGAVVTSETAARARRHGIDLERHLATNDVYPALAELGALIRTGRTGTNVMDVQVVLID